MDSWFSGLPWTSAAVPGTIIDGPGRIRTYDQGIHSAPAFPPGVDYLFTRERGELPDGGN